MDDTLTERVATLERAVTDGDHDLTALTAEAEARDRLAELDTQLADLTDRVAELEATTQALRGYVGNIRAVNQDVEKRADAAIAKVDHLETVLAADDVPDTRLSSEDMTHPNQTDQQTVPSAPSADGDADPIETETPSTCHVCGRAAANTSQATADQSADAGSPVQPLQTSETLVPEATETGPLQRLRELL